jgi:hypothetical protein
LPLGNISFRYVMQTSDLGCSCSSSWPLYLCTTSPSSR